LTLPRKKEKVYKRREEEKSRDVEAKSFGGVSFRKKAKKAT